MKTIRIASVAVVLVLATAAFFFFRRGGDAGAQEFRLSAVTRGDLSSSLSATGQLSAVRTVQDEAHRLPSLTIATERGTAAIRWAIRRAA